MLIRLIRTWWWLRNCHKWAVSRQLTYRPEPTCEPRVLASFKAVMWSRRTAQISYRYYSAVVSSTAPTFHRIQLDARVAELFGDEWIVNNVEWLDYNPDLEIIELE